MPCYDTIYTGSSHPHLLYKKPAAHTKLPQAGLERFGVGTEESFNDDFILDDHEVTTVTLDHS